MIKERFDIPGKAVEDIIKKEIIRIIQCKWTNFPTIIKDVLNLPIEIINSPEVKFAVKEGFLKSLEVGCCMDDYREKIFDLTDETIYSPEVQAAIKEGLEYALINICRDDFCVKALDIKKSFSITDEVINSPEIQSSIKKGLIKWLEDKSSSIWGVFKIKKEFNVPKDTINSSRLWPPKNSLKHWGTLL